MIRGAFAKSGQGCVARYIEDGISKSRRCSHRGTACGWDDVLLRESSPIRLNFAMVGFEGYFGHKDSNSKIAQVMVDAMGRESLYI